MDLFELIEGIDGLDIRTMDWQTKQLIQLSHWLRDCCDSKQIDFLLKHFE